VQPTVRRLHSSKNRPQAARDIEAARIKSIIDPRLSDQVRREAFRFVDELKRAV
jgi:hypothetical protein